MTLLELEHVNRRHPRSAHEHLVLRDVSLELYPGELTAVWGLRRSGRSTLLRVAAGIEPPTAASCASKGATSPPAAAKRSAAGSATASAPSAAPKDEPSWMS